MKRRDAKDAREFQEPDEELDRLASVVVAAAIEVHPTPSCFAACDEWFSPLNLASVASWRLN